MHYLFGVDLYQIQIKITRKSITFTRLNDEWLKEQVKKGEYSSKSELVNDLLRQTRDQQVQVDSIRAKLDRAEKRGFTDEGPEEILSQSKSLTNG